MNPERVFSTEEMVLRMFNEGIGADFEIHCGNEIFKCHQVILSYHSKTFYELFSGKHKSGPGK